MAYSVFFGQSREWSATRYAEATPETWRHLLLTLPAQDWLAGDYDIRICVIDRRGDLTGAAS